MYMLKLKFFTYFMEHTDIERMFEFKIPEFFYRSRETIRFATSSPFGVG